MSDAAEEPEPIDAGRLIAEVRAGKPEAIDAAYRMTFRNPLGRVVLLHHLQMSGVGRQLGPDELKYKAGMIDGAISLCAAAGYDQVSLAATLLTDNLEENPDAAAYNYDPHTDDEPLDFGD